MVGEQVLLVMALAVLLDAVCNHCNTECVCVVRVAACDDTAKLAAATALTSCLNANLGEPCKCGLDAPD